MRVRKLLWHKLNDNWYQEYHRALFHGFYCGSNPANYTIHKHTHDTAYVLTCWYGNQGLGVGTYLAGTPSYQNLEEAKNACQKDYEFKIMLNIEEINATKIQTTE